MLGEVHQQLWINKYNTHVKDRPSPPFLFEQSVHETLRKKKETHKTVSVQWVGLRWGPPLYMQSCH